MINLFKKYLFVGAAIVLLIIVYTQGFRLRVGKVLEVGID